jgi:hypothetical protein
MSLYETLIAGQLFALVLAFIAGMFYYLWNNRWGPKDRIKYLKKSPFSELRLLGFKDYKDNLKGTFNGYDVVAQYQWTGTKGKPSVVLYVLFDPKRRTRGYVSIDRIKELNKLTKKENIVWSFNCVSKEWSFNFRLPKFNEIEIFLNSAVSILKNESLEAISLEESENRTKLYEEYLK